VTKNPERSGPKAVSGKGKPMLVVRGEGRHGSLRNHVWNSAERRTVVRGTRQRQKWGEEKKGSLGYP